MANAQRSISKHSISTQHLAFIVGAICLLGFLIDILVIGLPPNPFTPQWRFNFLQQVADRSLLLFVGSGLLLYSKLDGRRIQLRIVSVSGLLLGVLLGLSSLLVIDDNLTLQRQAEANINTQAVELRARLLQSQEDRALSQDISSEAFSKALQSVQTQAETLRQEAKLGATKTLISSAGNLFVVGGGMIAISRIGLLRSFAARREPRKV